MWTLKAKERALPRPLQNTASGRAGGGHHQTHRLTSNYGARYTLTNAQKIRSPPYKSEGMFHTSTLISISSKVPRGLRLLSQRLQIIGGRNVWTCILEIGKGAHTKYNKTNRGRATRDLNFPCPVGEFAGKGSPQK